MSGVLNLLCTSSGGGLPYGTQVPITFTIGSALGGGYFAGKISTSANGVATHYLIVSPKATGQLNLPFSTTQTNNITGASSKIDGLANTNLLYGLGTAYDAANAAKALTIGGYTDWYVPAMYELQVLFYNLKPVTAPNWTSPISGQPWWNGANPYAVSPQPINTIYSSYDPGQTTAYDFIQGNSEAMTWTGGFAGISYFNTSTETEGVANLLNQSVWFVPTDSNDTSQYSGYCGLVSSNYKNVPPFRAIRKIPVSEIPTYLPTVPDKPTNVSGSVVIENTYATVTFTAPATGGSPITQYTVKAYVGGIYSGISTSGTSTSINVTGLTIGTTYTFKVVATNASGTSLESNASGNVTPYTLIGSAMAGGYYAGIINDGGTQYKIIVSPRASGSNGGNEIQHSTVYGSVSAARTLTNGLAASNAMNNTSYPAAYYCRGLNIGGYNDWYLPARDEMQLIYKNLKPSTTANFVMDPYRVDSYFGTGQIVSAYGNDGYGSGYNAWSVPTTPVYTANSPTQTIAANFIEGSLEGLGETFYRSYCTSTEKDYYGSWSVNMEIGELYSFSKTGTNRYVRAIRRIPV